MRNRIPVDVAGAGRSAGAVQHPLRYASAGGAGDGSSWDNAYPTLQDALAVAAGVYYPDEGAGQTNDDRTSTFMLQNGVAIYGGFDGTEAQREERDWENNITVLSGDIDHETFPDSTDVDGVVNDAEDISGENAYHVVTSIDTDSSAVLDGFIITAGSADGLVFPDDGGGGLAAIGFSENVPAAQSNAFDGNSNLTLLNVDFTGDLAL